MAKRVVNLYMLTKIVGNTTTVRYVSQADDGTHSYGEATELTAAERAQLVNVARSLQGKIEATLPLTSGTRESEAWYL